MIWESPLVVSTFFSFPSAEYPMKRLSGDQKGEDTSLSSELVRRLA